MQSHHLYFHHKLHEPKLTRLWFKTRPVIDLSTLPVQLEHYGRPLQYTLHEIVPWDNPAITETLPLPHADQPVVLILNARRLWDDPARTQASLSADDRPLIPRLENEINFVEIPADRTQDHSVTLHIESDLPLPDAMPMKTWVMNEDFDLNLGKQPDWWFHSLLSENLIHHSGLRPDACMLFDQGTMRLPYFSSPDRINYVEFRYEFFQGHAFFQTQRERFEDGERVWVMPPARAQSRATFRLGRGTGHLEWAEKEFTSSLPDFDTQFRMGVNRVIDRHGFVKIFDAVIYSVPAPSTAPGGLVLGAPRSAACLQQGFYWEEKHLGRYPVRWTEPRAVIGVPLLDPGTDVDLIVDFFDHLQEGGTPVRLTWNGTPLETAVSSLDSGATRLVCTVPAGSMSDAEEQILEISAPAWSPADIHGTADKRLLGIMLHQVVWTHRTHPETDSTDPAE
jgi:hypothetical protein